MPAAATPILYVYGSPQYQGGAGFQRRRRISTTAPDFNGGAGFQRRRWISIPTLNRIPMTTPDIVGEVASIVELTLCFAENADTTASIHWPHILPISQLSWTAIIFASRRNFESRFACVCARVRACVIAGLLARISASCMRPACILCVYIRHREKSKFGKEKAKNGLCPFVSARISTTFFFINVGDLALAWKEKQLFSLSIVFSRSEVKSTSTKYMCYDFIFFSVTSSWAKLLPFHVTLYLGSRPRLQRRRESWAKRGMTSNFHSFCAAQFSI